MPLRRLVRLLLPLGWFERAAARGFSVRAAQERSMRFFVFDFKKDIFPYNTLHSQLRICMSHDGNTHRYKRHSRRCPCKQ